MSVSPSSQQKHGLYTVLRVSHSRYQILLQHLFSWGCMWARKTFVLPLIREWHHHSHEYNIIIYSVFRAGGVLKATKANSWSQFSTLFVWWEKSQRCIYQRHRGPTGGQLRIASSTVQAAFAMKTPPTLRWRSTVTESDQNHVVML